MKVLVVDDDKLVCVSLKTILEADPEISVIGTGNNGKQAIELYRRLEPDILLIDIRMDTMTGLEAGEVLLKQYPNARILYLTTFLDDAYIIKALKIGAKGYLLKQNFESIVPALKAVYMGQSVFGDEISTKLPELLHGTASAVFSNYDLTDREIELLVQISEGLNNREISESMHLSEGTVRNYISVLLEKLHLRDRTQLAVFYYKNR
ncbi:response regulator [Ruminiclostridium cellobioparum]|uniref:Stage 0 sporulation protein A homolog n=1 Tax=Ruminiclostridium cellobioparum subsp. termitidis CT1112 TaxID=1195236 RepID=S0FN94_RUMCE|nr:response regulator transcription factor [Ruminiclostridium cellobioparum]EMS69953.1 two component LuxR family transcriptional regulator [Ruminiclostridium cellobioparum subsp. termitidis CT1112]